MAEWTAVAKEKPGDGTDVLACHAEDKWVDVLQWVESADAWIDPLDGDIIEEADEPTHWMALPAMPA